MEAVILGLGEVFHPKPMEIAGAICTLPKLATL